METRQMSNEVLVERLLPAVNHNPADRAIAWEEWYRNVGAASVMAFVRIKNHTSVPDDDIVQEAIVTAYEQVEDGRYKPRAGIPLTAYVKGIARNKIREAHRRTHRLTPLDDIPPATLERQRLGAEISHPLETIVERRERLMVLNNRLAQLPPLRRQVIERYLRGHGTAEIAQAIEMSQAAVRQHKSRALRSLREPQH